MHSRSIDVLKNEIRFHIELARRAEEDGYEENRLRHLRYIEEIQSSIEILQEYNT